MAKLFTLQHKHLEIFRCSVNYR